MCLEDIPSEDYISWQLHLGFTDITEFKKNSKDNLELFLEYL